MKIGLLPMYVALYDEKSPEMREKLDDFYSEVAKIIENRGSVVIKAPFCRLKPEFAQAVHTFESEKVDAVVTLHMAYSPSLECADVLASTMLPLIVFDTTCAEDFSDAQNPAEILYNHGIHGVMDMCNLLTRSKKEFAICAGHYKDERVLRRLFGYIKAAACAAALKGSAVGSVGGFFDGMGDFQVSEEELKSSFDIAVVHATKDEMVSIFEEITDSEIAEEMINNFNIGYALSEFSEETHRLSVKTDLVLRKWIAKTGVNAIAVNFQTVTNMGLPTMPFMEASRAMTRGIGYAGEGDVLTAAVTGALLSEYPETSFAEIFCPDWKNNTLFISHMGEMNYKTTDTKIELFEKEFVFGNGANPIVGTASFKAGTAVFVNIFKSHDGFKLFLAPVEVKKETTDNFAGEIRGWLAPRIPVSVFLERLSLLGATHHSILVYNSSIEELSFFSKCLGIDCMTDI